MRDEFLTTTKEALAKRVNNICSNPSCRAQTSGPQNNPNGVINVGVASHITAASPGGKRYNSNLSSEERINIENGIWLCQNCSKLIDSDENKYTTELLREWKKNTENEALDLIGKTNREPISNNKSENLYFKELTFYEIRKVKNEYIFGMILELMNKDFKRSLVIDSFRYKGTFDYDQSKVGITSYSGTAFKLKGEVTSKYYLNPGGKIYIKLEILESKTIGSRLGGLMKYQFDGRWIFAIDGKNIEVTPHRTIYQEKSISNKEWKTNLEGNIEGADLEIINKE